MARSNQLLYSLLSQQVCLAESREGRAAVLLSLSLARRVPVGDGTLGELIRTCTC